MTTFRIWFSNENYAPESEIVTSFNQDDALILAQAERIKAGKDRTLNSIENMDKVFKKVLNDL